MMSTSHGDGRQSDDDGGGGSRDRGPLAGLVVADFSRILAGPYATMLMADLGAEVVKVESPGGDDTRTWKPPTRDGVSTYYLAINRNKRSIALDLRDAQDLALARRLVERADVLVENMRPGGMARFGLGETDLRDRNPGLVRCSITGFGTGAGAGMAGYDLAVQAAAGLMSLTGPPDGPGHRAGVAVFDVIAGLHALTGVLAALHDRQRTGRGQHVEVDLLSSALSGLVNHASAVVAGDVTPTSMGNAHPSLFPYEPMPTADGSIVVIVGNDQQFRVLCRLLALDPLADDERFATNEQRTANRDELRPLLVERLARRTTAQWAATFRDAGLAGGPVNTVRQGIELADALGLSPVVEVGEGDGRTPGVRTPMAFSDTAPSYRRPPPGLDEHRDEITAWLRGQGALDRAVRPGRHPT